MNRVLCKYNVRIDQKLGIVRGVIFDGVVDWQCNRGTALNLATLLGECLISFAAVRLEIHG